MPLAPTGQKIDFNAINMQPQGVQFNPTQVGGNTILAQPTNTGAAGVLTAEQRAHLDQVILKARELGYSIEKQKLIVEDFKQKYAGQVTPETPQYTSAGTNIAPLNVEKAKIGLQNNLYDILNQAEAGVNQVKAGVQEQINAKNPVENTLGLTDIGSGAVTAAFSPFAPVIKPIGDFINNKIIQPISNAYSDLPQIQKFSQTPAATAVETGAKIAANTTNIAGGLVGGLGNKAVTGEARALASGATTKAIDLVTPSLEQDIGKGLGFTGKMSGTTALQKTEQSTRALKSIVDYAPNIKVKDANGIEVPFNPSKATFAETLDAFNQTKQAVYKEYSDLAGTASDFTAQDFLQVQSVLENTVKNSTGAFKAKAASILKDMQENYGSLNPKTGEIYFKNTPATDIQEFIQKINTDVNPLSDKAAAEVSSVASQEFRDILDKKIEAAPGKGYQDLRYKYADLKSIENDLVNQFKKAARGQGGFFAKAIEAFGTADLVLAFLKGNPAAALGGAATFSVGKYLELIRDPQKALNRAFEKIQRDASQNTQTKQPKIINQATIPGTLPKPTQKASLLDTARQIGSFVKDNIGDQRGFIKNPVSKGPDVEKMAKNLNGKDVKYVQDFVENPTLDNWMKLQPLLESEKSLGKLTLQEVQDFFQEVFITRNQPDFKPAQVGGATPIRNADNTRLAGSISMVK